VTVAVFQFGDFRLDCDRFELCRKGRRLKLERQPLELLILLATKRGQIVTREEIAKCLWKSDVFVDTEHGINTAIRKIRQALGEDKEQPRFVQTVSGQGYRFIAPLVIVGAPPEPESPGPILPAEPSVSITPGSAQQSQGPRPKLWLVLGSGLAVVAALILAATLGPHAWIERLLHRTAQPAIASLAVLPLDNLSGDPAQEYFADGMTDELITMLAKDSTLRITSRTSVMQYKGARKPLREIARALDVDGILEGSISRANGQVHMTLQLIRADSDTHLWADSYDRDLNDVAALPNQAARDIATRLHSSVARITKARYVNPEAHDAYLRGRFLWFRGQNEEAGKYFKKAVDLQPDYALGWAGLSLYYGEEADGRANPAQALPQQDDAARKAVDLDAQLAEGHMALGVSILSNHWDSARALQELSRAIELDPRLTQAIHFRARILSILGRHQEAIQAQKTATELDPFERPWAMVTILDEARQYDTALAEAHQQLHAEPHENLYYLISVAYRGKGMPREWAEALEKYLQLSGDPTSAAPFHHAFQQGGQRAAVHWQLGQLERKSKSSYVSPVDLALLYAQLENREKTLALLEQGFREHSPLLLWIQTDPAYDFLHADARYRSIIRRVGLPPAY